LAAYNRRSQAFLAPSCGGDFPPLLYRTDVQTTKDSRVPSHARPRQRRPRTVSPRVQPAQAAMHGRAARATRTAGGLIDAPVVASRIGPNALRG